MKKLLLILLPTLILAQEDCHGSMNKVGINVGKCPTTTLDIGGNLRVRDMLLKTAKYLLVADEEGYVSKILLSDVLNPPTNTSCPQFIVDGSSPYYIKFKGGSYISNPNNPIKVNGLTFNGAGSWVENNITYYTYTNVSGMALDLSSFSVLFGSHTCNY